MMKTPDAGRTRQALRAATMDSHRRVDDAFGDFSLESRDDYRSFLTAHGRALAAMEPVARPARSRLPLLAQDLAALGDSMPEPLPMRQDMKEGGRWGLLYTLEGSRLGGAMLSRQVGEGLPRAYLSAVHDKGEWIAFQRALDGAAAEGGEGWLEDAVQGALAAFALFATAAQEQRAMRHG
ncbi:biliverdin-producing heme oxygenase [Sphingobium rhizovicinum]|uniref:Biliverdin-producing heme oxygenase n=1 Tax=Sphingobium rhizovicinum TaxID=432308 RepID=A0ABV7NB10_9SPHN